MKPAARPGWVPVLVKTNRLAQIVYNQRRDTDEDLEVACPDENDIVEYVDGLLPEREATEIEDHLDCCASCRQLVVGLSSGASEDGAPIEAETVDDRPPRQDSRSTGSRPPADGPLLLAAEIHGRYTDLTERARGGQAVVYAARDVFFDREIAIKVLDPTSGARGSTSPSARIKGTAASTARFLREARITSQLAHPNVVNVHELGQREDGSLYYTMPLVQGRSLARALADCTELPQRLKLLEHFIDVCNAVAYAHSRGVLHRDLKPANVMLGEFGETILLDWGLATDRSDEELPARPVNTPPSHPNEVGKTEDGTFLGTPPYVSPEQASGQSDRVDERSDIWSLGAVLYEILTDHPPFEGKTTVEVIKQIESSPVPPVSETCPEVAPELAAVAEKALQRDRARRYTSARELAAELSAYMTGKLVAAYDYSSWELLRRFARRNRLLLTAAGLVVVMGLAALISVTISYRGERRALVQANQARKREHEERLRATYRLAQAYGERARRLLRQRRHLSARIFAAAALANNPAHPRSPHHDGSFVARQPQSKQLLLDARSTMFQTRASLFRRLTTRVQAPIELWSAELFAGGRRVAAGCADGSIRVWDTRSGARLQVLTGHKGHVNSVSISSGGGQLASGGRDGKVRLWDLRKGTLIRTLAGHDSRVNSVRFSPDGGTLASTSKDHTVRIWEAATGKELHRLVHAQDTFGLAFSPDGSLLASGCHDSSVTLWEVSTGRLQRRLKGHTGEVVSASFSPDGRRLATAGLDHTIIIWSPHDGRRVSTIREPTVFCLRYSPNGRWLASGSLKGRLQLWDAASGAHLSTVDAHGDEINGVSFSADGQRLASASFDKTLKVWELTPRPPIQTLAGHRKEVITAVFSPSGEQIASASKDGTVRLWNVKTARSSNVLSTPGTWMWDVAFSADGRLLAAAGRDGLIRTWALPAGRMVKRFRAHGGKQVMGVAFSPDGLLASGGDKEPVVRIWDPRTGRQRATLSGHHGETWGITYSHDGHRIAGFNLKGLITIWDAQAGTVVRQIQPGTGWGSWPAFSFRGDMLAAAGAGGSINLWGIKRGQIVKTLEGHSQWASRFAFAPDDQWLASSADDSSVILWAIPRSEAVLMLRFASRVGGVDISPNGRQLVATPGARLRLYDLSGVHHALDPNALFRQAQRDAGATLTGFTLRPVGSGNKQKN